jgi:hypothetical protein
MTDGSCVSIQNQKAARAPRARRLRDPVPRKEIVEEVNAHETILDFRFSILDPKMRVFPKSKI